MAYLCQVAAAEIGPLHRIELIVPIRDPEEAGGYRPVFLAACAAVCVSSRRRACAAAQLGGHPGAS